jgi:Kef-type K+ transport system membrane component KefB
MSDIAILKLLLALCVILLVGRGTAECARRLGQPEVLGELIGGLLLGPSLLGALLPGVRDWVFTDPAVVPGLQALSWIGAILLLLVAGMETDLQVLKSNLKPGLLSAALAIPASIAAGTAFGFFAIHVKLPSALFLGVVLSVTAVSVAAKLLIESGALLRTYAQVILAAGIATEIVAWLFVSTIAELGQTDVLRSALRALFLACVVFAVMLTVGRKLTFWAMRRITDYGFLVRGQLSLVLVLVFASAAMTQAMGLHALLGAFIFGIVLSQSPRVNTELKENLQTLIVTFFAPVFFVLAGMRVNVLRLDSAQDWLAVGGLFLVSVIAKAGFAALGARFGGLRPKEAMLVGIGVNLKGGTDVIVAILGTELGLLSNDLYTTYTVAAIATVLASPRAMNWLQRRLRPSMEERNRQQYQQAKERAYLADVQRVLVPVLPELRPSLPANIIRTIAMSKTDEREVFDVTHVSAGDSTETEVQDAQEKLAPLNDIETVELVEQPVADEDPLPAIIESAKNFDLLALGAERPKPGHHLSLGELQDEIIEKAETDIMVVVRDESVHRDDEKISSILVPINGTEYSMAAADVAAYIAKSHNAKLVFFNATKSQSDSWFWHESEELLDPGYHLLHEAQFRCKRLGVETEEIVRLAEDPAEAILEEISRDKHQLVVMGVMERKSNHGLFFGKQVASVLTQPGTPVVLLISHKAAA